jgi:hypothetical protein
MHVHAFVSTVFIVSLLIPGSAALKAFADSACMEQPDRDTPQGEHWYFHIDREKNRKCWHLGTIAAAPVHEAPALPRMERTHTSASPVEAAFSSLFRGLQRLFRRPMQHEATADEPRIIQNDATKPLTIEDIAQPQLPEDRPLVRPASTGTLTPAQRKALYEEYLRWEELQRGSVTAPVRSP